MPALPPLMRAAPFFEVGEKLNGDIRKSCYNGRECPGKCCENPWRKFFYYVAE